MPITPSDYNDDAIKGQQLSKLMGKEILDRLKGGMPETLAHVLCVMAAEIDALKAALAERNIGDRTADSMDVQVLKIGGEDVASAISGKASSTHTHDLTFETSSGSPDYSLSSKNIIKITAGGISKKVRFNAPFTNASADPSSAASIAGEIYRNYKTGDIWIAANNQDVDGWVLIHNRIHDLIVQRQNVVINGQGDARNILCDKQKYTIDGNGDPVFERVDLYDLAKWKNRGDVINVGGEVAYDPWGDGYPMRITEYQAQKDANNKWYCTNINLRGFKYSSSSEGSYWGNKNHDDTTNKDFMEFTSWS